MEKVKQKFSAWSLKLNLWSPRCRTDVLNSKMLNSKNFRSMYFMRELPTNKANFIFKNTQDFNQTTHAGPHDLNVFTDNISFYFYPIISIKNLIKQSCNVMSRLFQHSLKIFRVLRLNICFRMQNTCCSTRSFLTWIAQQFQNGRRQ